MPTTQDLLTEAEAALHSLQIGKAKVSVGYGDRRVEYTPASIPKLQAYIAQLKAKIAGRPRVRNRVRYGVPD